MIAVAIQGTRLPTIKKGELLSLTIIKVRYPCLPLLLAQLSSETLLRSHRGTHLCTLYKAHHEQQSHHGISKDERVQKGVYQKLD